MDITKPTSPLAVAKWLRTLATPDQIEIGGGYPYLFGMATVKLAEAHAEIARLTAKLAERHACESCELCPDHDPNYDGPADSDDWSGGFAENH